MKTFERRLLRFGAIGVAVLLGASCTEAPTASDVVGELPGEIAEQAVPSKSLPPTVECLTPANYHTVESEGPMTAVEVRWASNVVERLQNGAYQLAWYDNGNLLGSKRSAGPVQAQLDFGEHLLTLALLDANGKSLSNPTSRCSIRVRITKPCEIDADCTDNFVCNVTRCVADGNGNKTCAFEPESDLSCCQQAFECSFGRYCDQANNRCVDCLNSADCNDKNQCTVDSCVDGRCLFQKVDSTCCDCSAQGASTGVAQCNDGKACTVDSCDCKTGQCSYVPSASADGKCCETGDHSACVDGDSCNLDLCVNNRCQHLPRTDVGPECNSQGATSSVNVQNALPFGQTHANAGFHSQDGLIAGPVKSMGRGLYSQTLYPTQNSAVIVKSTGVADDLALSLGLDSHASEPAYVDMALSNPSRTVYAGQPSTHLLVQVTDKWGLPVSGTVVNFNTSVKSLETSCKTGVEGRCQANIKYPGRLFSKSQEISITAIAGKVSSRANLTTMKVTPAPEIAAGSASLVMTDTPHWLAGEQYTAQAVVNGGQQAIGAYDLAIEFNDQAVKVVGVNSLHPQFAEPVWHVDGGTLKLNSMLSDVGHAGVTGENIPVAQVTFEALVTEKPMKVGIQATLVNLTNTARFAVSSGNSVVISNSPNTAPLVPAGILALPKSHRNFVASETPLEFVATKLLPTGVVTQSSFVTKERVVPGLQKIAVAVDGVETTARVWAAPLKSVELRLNRTVVRPIAGLAKQFQTAQLSVWANWQGSGRSVQTEITSSVSVKTPAGMAYEPSTQAFKVTRDGSYTAQVFDSAGRLLGTVKVDADSTDPVAVKDLRVVAPCQIKSIAKEASKADFGGVVHTFGVTGHLRSHESKCRVSAVAIFSDGTTMALGEDSGVRFESLRPDLLSLHGRQLEAHDNGNVLIRAVLGRDGSVIADGETAVSVELPKAVRLVTKLASGSIAASSGDPAATLKGLNPATEIAVWTEYADGTRQLMTADAVFEPRNALVTCSTSGRCNAGDGESGKALIDVRVPRHPHLTTSCEIEVVRATALAIQLHSPMSPTSGGNSVSSLARIENTSTWQDARVQVLMTYSDGSVSDVSSAKGTSVRVVKPTTTRSSSGIVTLADGRVTAVAPGQVDIIASASGLQARLKSLKVLDKHVDVVALKASSEATLSGVYGHANSGLDVIARLSDGSHRRVSGSRTIEGLLTYKSTVEGAATVDKRGMVKVLANRSTVFKVILNEQINAGVGGVSPVEVAVDCNLVPAVGDLDLGDESGLALKDRQVGDKFTLSARLNAGNSSLGAFDVLLTYDPAVVRVTAVTAAPGSRHSVFNANWESEPGKVYVTGSMHPDDTTLSGNVSIFDLKLTALKGGTGITEFAGVVRSVVSMNGLTIGEATPRAIVAGFGELDPNCADEPIYGDANDNCSFGAEDPLFVQRYLAGQVVATDAQKLKMDAFPDGQLTVADALYLSQVLAKLTHFVKLKLSGNDDGGLAYLDVHVIDRDQKTVNSDLDVMVEARAEKSPESLVLEFAKGVGKDASTRLGGTQVVTVDNIDYFRGGIKAVEIPSGTASNKVSVSLVLTTKKSSGDTLKSVAFLGSEEVVGSTFKAIKVIDFPLSGNKGCNTDADCDTSHWCDNTVGPGAGSPLSYLCKPKKDDGKECPKSGACKSSHCQNNFCCEKGDCCTETSQCEANYTKPSACSDVASCQGARQLAQCTNFMCHSLPINDDKGCTKEVAASLCGCYKSVFCDGSESQTAPTCPTSCTSDSECDNSCHCDGTCEADLPNGSGCDEDSDCISSYCNNGVCCDGDLCCTTDGACSSLSVAASCADPSTCQGSHTLGQCNPVSFQCEAIVVDDDSACTSDVTGQVCPCSIDQMCTGQTTQTPPQCPIGGCTGEDNSKCKEACHCDLSVCQEDLDDGSACDENSDCKSNYCNNGFCCTNDGSNPVCCGGSTNCPGDVFSGAPQCFAGSTQLSSAFGGSQGNSQLLYQMYNSAAGYQDLSFGGGQWTGPQGMLISASAMHPSSTKAASLGFKVRGGGELRVIGELKDNDVGGGDGVLVELRRNETVIWSRTLSDGFEAVTINVSTAVAVGDIVRLMVFSRANNSNDATSVAVTFVLGTCQGQTDVPSCNQSICGTQTIEQDTGCGASTVVRQCAPYKNAVCNGQAEQQEPACATSCKTSADVISGASCVPSAPITWMGFDEGSGSVSSDRSGNGYTAQVIGGVGPTWVNGLWGYSLRFAQQAKAGDALAEAVELLGTKTLRFGGDFSASGLIRWSGPGTSVNQIIVGKGNNWGFGLRSGKLAFHVNGEFGAGSLWEVLSNQSSAIPQDTWVHVAVAYSGAEVELYLNGVLVASAPLSGALPYSTASAVTIGQRGSVAPNTGLFKGNIDSLRLWDTAICGDILNALVKGLMMPPNANAGALTSKKPVSLLRFDEGKGSNALHEGIGGFSGKLQNGVTWGDGKFGSGVVFTGKTGQQVTLVGSDTVDLSGGFSASGWFKVSSVAGVQWLASQFGTFDLGIKDGKLQLRLHKGGGDLVELASSVTVSAGLYHHGAVTFDGSTARIYLDGRQVGTTSSHGLGKSSLPIVLGMLNPTTPEIGVMSGTLDEWLFADFAVSQSVITQSMTGLVPGSGQGSDLFSSLPFSYLTFDISSDNNRRFANLAAQTGGGGNKGNGPDYLRGAAVSVGPSYAASVPGRWGNGVQFSQSGKAGQARQDALEIAVPQDLDLGGGFSVSVWLNWQGQGSHPLQWILNKVGQLGVGIENGKVFVSISGDAALKASTLALNVVPTQGQWTHLVVSWDTVQVTVYVNGQLKGTVPFQSLMASGSAPIVVGQAGGSSTNTAQYLGIIDELTILSQGVLMSDVVKMLKGLVVSPAEKVAVMKRHNGMPCPTDNGTCLSNVCSNDFCCTGGDCCAHGGQCPGKYTILPSCGDASNCQGTRGDPVCQGFSCLTSTVDDDSDCLKETVSKTCGCYPTEFCSGDKKQASPICPTSCTEDTECDADCTCEGACVPKLENGLFCDENADCISDMCVDNTCCSSKCEGLCEACNVNGNQGTCTEVPKNTDPAEECDGTGTCGGTCDGNKQCQFPVTTVDCGTCRRCNGLGFCTNFNAETTDPDLDCPLCQVCDGKGACAPSAQGTDIKNECSESAASSCGTNGVCDGGGACQQWVLGTECTTQECLFGFIHAPDECDGLGTCIDKGTIDCSPFLCDGKVCGTSCESDKDCNSEAYCHEGKCYGKKDPGEKCTNSLDCGDGFCVEGVCCITSCTESCYSCNLAGSEGTCTLVPNGQDPKDECNGTGLCGGTCDGKAGCQYPSTNLSCGTCVHCNGLGDCSKNVKKNTDPDEQCGLCGVCDGSGACEAAVIGTDPKGECEQKPQSSCGQDGVCNGKGGCQLWVSGTECEAPKCDKDNGIGYLSRTCNGLGDCSAVKTEACDPYICGPNACLTNCGVDDHCISGFWCNSGVCEKKKDLSDSCFGGNECVSGFCVDKVCCDSACSGACKSCNIPGKSGQCTNFTAETDPEDDCALCQVCDGKGSCTVVQDGLDPLNECSQAPAATCKFDGACDGSGDCRLWASESVCVSQSCSDGVVQTVDLCDGKGACVDGGTQDCAPYKCNGVNCSTECNVDSQCVSTHWCNKPICSPKKDLGDACGGGNECKSDFCADGVCCVNSCASVCAQCNLSGSKGQCSPHSAGTDPEVGCGMYWCNGTGACHNKCSSDPDCKTGNWCNGNQCEGKKPNGKTCSGNNQCLSDFCVDGVCCNDSCGGECRACDVLGKAGECSNVPNGQDIDEECSGTGSCGGVCDGQAKCYFPPTDQNCGTCRRCNGVGGCGFVSSGADPDGNCQLCEACNGNGSCVNAALGTDVKNECSESASESCGLTGGCSGKGACGFYTTDVICKAETCTGTTHQFADKCSGSGECSDGGTEDCAPYVCNGNTCGTECTTNSDCVSTHWCRGTQCVGKKLNGDACSANAECQSSHCANGFCCSGTTNCGSGKSCAQLGWGGSGGSPDVCGASDSIGCSDLKTYDEAVAYCESAGGRLCSWVEVNGGEVAGTGCGYDSQRIWTSTSCGEGSAFTQSGAPASVGSHPKTCTLKTQKAYVRCCADNCQPNDCCSQANDCAGNKSCAQLGWETGSGSAIVCGASETGGLSCSGLKKHQDAVAHCENVGARLCTIEELQANEAAGTGCGYDSQRVWTSSECSKGGYWTQAGTSTELGNVPRQCVEGDGEAYVRCCADVFPAEYSRKGLCQDPGNCSGDRIDAVCNANNQCNGNLVDDPTPCESVTCVPGYCTGGSGVLQHVDAKTCNTKGQCSAGGSVNVCNDGNVCTDDLCGNPNKSVKSCSALGWGGGGGSSVCAASDSVGCSGLVDHAAAVALCESKGGRLCSYTELDSNETAGTGCGYGDKRVWTGTSCSGTGVWTQAGNNANKEAVGQECTEKVDKAYVRCCADKVAAGGSGCHYPYNNYTDSCYDGPPGTLNVGVCKAGTKGCSNGAFQDCTGAVVPSGESCNQKDDDCDGIVDEENATGCTTYYKDVDDDNFGVTGDTKCLCKPAGHYTATKGKDCADGDASVNPDATEACNGKDDDCDNQVDEEDALNCTVYYKDVDDDGYGQTADKKCLCKKNNPYDTTKKDDCNDAVDTTYPGAKELCNAVDDDCDNGNVGGGIDEDYPLGLACDSTGDADSCKEGKYVCNKAETGVECINDGALVIFSGDRVDGSTIVNEAGPDLDGTVVGSVTIAAGKQDNALAMNGGYVRINNDKAKMDGLAKNGQTFTWWAKVNETPPGYATQHVHKAVSTSDATISMYHFGSSSGWPKDRVCAYFSVGGQWRNCCDWAKNTMTSSQGWQHFGVSYVYNEENNITTVRSYRNGDLQKSCSYTGVLSTNTAQMRVGRGWQSPFPGSIDEFAWWGYTLNDTEVKEVMQGGIKTKWRNREVCDGEDNDCQGGKDELYTDLSNACSMGDGPCANSGNRVCHESGIKTKCNVTGKPQGTSCNDNVNCTHTDVCSGGDASSCGGQAYTCSGACRSCDGSGTCTVASDKCFIAGCDPAQPGCGDATKCISTGSYKGSEGDSACHLCSPGKSQSDWSAANVTKVCRSASCSGSIQTISGTAWSDTASTTCPGNSSTVSGGFLKCTGSGCGYNCSDGYLGYSVGVKFKSNYTVKVKYADYQHNCNSNETPEVTIYACSGNNTGCKKVASEKGPGSNDWRVLSGTFEAIDTTMVLRVDYVGSACCGCDSSCSANCKKLADDLNLYVDNIELLEGSGTAGFVHHSTDYCGAGGNAKRCVDAGTTNCDDNQVCTDNNCSGAGGCSYSNNSYEENCYTGQANTKGVGTCTSGIRTCQGGAFGSCAGEVTPVAELCAVQGEDGLDNNCDGNVDNIGDFKTWYRDKDSDNHGDPNGPTKQACNQPAGYSLLNDDCDDNDPKNYPGNTEVCDDQDNNCQGGIDETFPSKGDACDSSDADSCAEGHKVCKADGSGVECGNTDGPYVAYDFDFGTATTVIDRANADGTHDLVGKDVTIGAGACSSTGAAKFTGTNYIRATGNWGKYAQQEQTVMLRIKPDSACCKVCSSSSQACGNSCISKSNSCSQPKGCACSPGEGTSGSKYIIGSMGAGDSNGCCWRWFIRQQSHKVRFGLWDGDSSYITSDSALNAGDWNTIAVTWKKGENAELWLNGVKQSGKSFISNVTAWGYLQMGASLWSGGTPKSGYQGLVDDVVIYPRRLTDSEIIDRMKNCTPAIEKNRDICDGLNNDCKGGKDDSFTDLGSGCTEGQHPTCQLSGSRICHPDGISTTCNVSGKASGVSCNDSNSCTHSDRCTGGDDSDCVGKSYSCSGTCRSCDGTGKCNLSSNYCYITSCDKAAPGCSGTCFKKDADPNGNINSKNSDDTSCKYCDPVTSATQWTNRPPGTSWACKNSSCSGLSFDPTHYCDGSGQCTDPANQSCNDNNKCTDDYCDGSKGCYTTNNEAVYDSNCYTGKAGTQNVGLCQGGIRYCKDGGPSNVCVGEVTPAKEICDGLDNDCDGQVDEGVKTTWYRDADNDGYGSPLDTIKACKKPKGYVAGGDDCADDAGDYKNPNGYWGKSVPGASINPGSPEVCDGIDNDCSGGGASDPYGSGADSGYDVGAACNSSDAASCQDSVKVCNKAGNGTTCIKKLVWGSRIFGKKNNMYDVSGFNNHAPANISSISSNLPPTKIPIQGGSTGYGSVGSFNGTSQYGIEYYTASDPHHSMDGPQMTMAAWIRWTGKSGWNMVLNKEYSFYMAHYDGRPYCLIETTGSGNGYWWGADEQSLLTKNKWHHVACTYSKASCRMEVWIDGVRRAWRNNYDNCGDLSASKWHMRVGRRHFYGGAHAEGNIANIGLYDIALNEAQIKELAKADGQGYFANEANYEFCDNLDNDCNNKVDDDTTVASGKGNSCSAGDGTCKNTGKRVCDLNQFAHDTDTDKFMDTICEVTGDAPGASCNDGNACTYNDTCSGGDISKCQGTSYSCSGTCRVCAGDGSCNLKSNTCYITTNCDPSSSSCSGSCFDKGDDPNGVSSSHDSGNTSCLKCEPGQSKSKWTNQPKTWICNNAECSGLTYHKADYCNGSGTCSNSGTTNCNDGNLCTNDSCSDGSGCQQTNNKYSQSCYSGPAGTLDVGICHAGTETCSNGKMGSCIGDQKPKTESCNGKDDNCNGAIDEENASGCSTFYKDSDGDGYGTNSSKCLCKGVYPYTATKKGDCDDGNKNANPGMTEKCNNFDDNCVNGNNEEGAIGCTTYYRDNDNDGYGQSGDSKCLCASVDPYDTTLKNDCADNNAAINPGQKELCNGIDDDCQGGIDEDYDVGTACSKGIGTCKNSGKKVCNSAKTGTKCSVTGKSAGTACKDSNLCTYGDVCTGGDNSYCKGTAYTCDDGKSCTDNNCIDDRQKKCSYPIKNNTCLIGGSCYNNGNKQSSTGAGACKYCKSASSKTQWTMAPSSWVCNPASCSGLIFYKADYCGNGNGVCNDKGTENCNKGNVCQNYSCSKNGCSKSNKGDNTKCGGSNCVGDTWHAKDFCKSGQCKDGGTTNCNNKDNSCRNGYCDGGCKIQNYNKGTKCGGENCSGSTYNKKDTCDGSGNCIDGKTLNCGALSNQCRLGKCTNSVGCQIQNYSSSTKCTNGKSNACSGNTWHYQDYCNGSGSCTNKGTKNCDSSDTTCRDYYCSGGCTYTNKSTSTVCAAKTCNGSCTKRAAKYCNGSGSCSNGGGQTSCGGNYCSSGDCKSNCSSNGTCCDTSGDNRTCIGGQCNNKQGCAGVCDASDSGDCKSGYSCINCNSSKCQHSGATYRCYKNYGSSSNCGCASWDSYNNCTSYKSCWYC